MEPQKVVDHSEINKEGEESPEEIEKKKKQQQIILDAYQKKDQYRVYFYQELFKKHNFWDKQPTLRADQQQQGYGDILNNREVNQQPTSLPQSLYWCEINVENKKELDQFYLLLTDHYVQDDDNTFRFDYSRQFLKWALTSPEYELEWLLGIRDKQRDNCLIASITGVPVQVSVESETKKMSQINFLCVHKEYRGRYLTPKLWTQIFRRVNLKNQWQLFYTSGTILPTPFTQAIYYHRALDVKKLVQIGFWGLGRNQTMTMLKKMYEIQEKLTINGIRLMNEQDAPSVTKLINDGLAKYKVKFIYTEQQVRHFFLPRDDVVYSYVVEKPDTDKKKPEITDFLSFYMLPSHVMKHPKHNMLYACYSFMNFATSVPFEELIKNALILAKSLKCDVYNCLNLMDNASVFENLYFQKGDGHLNYYMYNWLLECRNINSQELGVVLF